MKRKEYKIRIENGEIKLLDNIDLTNIKEGTVIFFDKDETVGYQSKPTWEAFEEIMKDVPEEEFKKLPADGALEHDHYIYGTPKKKKK